MLLTILYTHYWRMKAIIILTMVKWKLLVFTSKPYFIGERNPYQKNSETRRPNMFEGNESRSKSVNHEETKIENNLQVQERNILIKIFWPLNIS